MLTTTLNEIRAAGPCDDGWKKLLTYLGKTKADDEALHVSTILASNGIPDTIWTLANVFGERGRAICVTFAADCAERVLPIWEAAYPDDERPRAATEAARSGSGDIDAAAAFAVYTARAGAFAAAVSAFVDAAAAADAAAYEEERTWQSARLRELIEEAE